MSETLGNYYVIEGTDGAGKTTQAAILRERLKANGVEAKELIEPGGTPIGSQLRAIILNPDLAKQPETELDLFTVARRELVSQVIAPEISLGTTLVCDRNWFSSVAYQGFGRGLDVANIIEKTKKAMGDFFLPTGIVILDVPLEAAEERLKSTGQKADWFEKQGREFFENVRRGYYWLSDQFEVELVDGTSSIESVSDDIVAALGCASIAERNG